MSEQRYTLEEARHELAVRECARYGHSWDAIEQFGAGPTFIVCNRCPKSYRVENPSAQEARETFKGGERGPAP